MKRKTRMAAPTLAIMLLIGFQIGWLHAGAGKKMPPVLAGSGKIAFAGARSSQYGIKPFPAPPDWKAAIGAVAGCFEGSAPVMAQSASCVDVDAGRASPSARHHARCWCTLEPRASVAP